MASTRTVRDLLTRSLRIATVLGGADQISADDAADALLSLNQMLDAWQAERLYAYTIDTQTLALTAGVTSYTIGPAGNINLALRPPKIEWAFTRDSQNFDRALQMVPREVYQSIALKSLGNTFPTLLFYEPQFPVGQLYLWPAPPASLTLYLGTWEVLTEYADLNATVALPPGFEDAIVYSMAERMAPEYGEPADPAVQRMAAMARARVKNLNLPDPRVTCELVGSNFRGGLTPAYVYTAGF